MQMCKMKLAMQGEPVWIFLEIMQMKEIIILSGCHCMCLLRHTCSAMFKLNKTLNDYVV